MVGNPEVGQKRRSGKLANRSAFSLVLDCRSCIIPSGAEATSSEFWQKRKIPPLSSLDGSTACGVYPYEIGAVALERAGSRSPSMPGVYPDNVGRGAPDGFAERGPECFRHLRRKNPLLTSSILRS